MKTPIHVYLIIAIAAISRFFRRAYDYLVDYKMQRISDSYEVLRQRRTDAHSKVVTEFKDAETTYQNLKARALSRNRATLDKTFAIEDRNAHITGLLVKGV